VEAFMKFRHLALLAIATVVITACNFTLAEDITPPPNYVPPTPMATLGPLFPTQAPSTENGELIFAEKCAPCHGATGLGDGEQGIQLGVTVPAFGLPEIARPASPAQWYTIVTQGNMERFMPPFASLNDQERWDVVAYAMTLHTSQDEIAQGKELFEANCADCSTDFFQDQAAMSALSGVELARIVKPSGKVLIFVPNDCLGPISEPEHVRKYDMRSLRKFLSRHWVVESISSTVEAHNGADSLFAVCRNVRPG
jgi:mono/diheme cytochrome c family protein